VSRKRRNSTWSTRPRAPIPFSLLESPAFLAISHPARQVFWRLVAEYGRHGGKDNGRLPCPFSDLEKWRISSNLIARAVRELVAVGLVEITQRGVAGNADQRRPALYLITCFAAAGGESMDGTHDYERITSIEEADALVAAAASPVSSRDMKNGSKGGDRLAEKQIPALKTEGETARRNEGETVELPPSELRVQVPPSELRLLSTFRATAGSKPKAREAQRPSLAPLDAAATPSDSSLDETQDAVGGIDA
jgi:hypothetical protein